MLVDELKAIGRKLDFLGIVNAGQLDLLTQRLGAVLDQNGELWGVAVGIDNCPRPGSLNPSSDSEAVQIAELPQTADAIMQKILAIQTQRFFHAWPAWENGDPMPQGSSLLWNSFYFVPR